MNQSSQQAKVEPMAAASAPVELTSGPTTVALPPVAAEQGKTLASRLSTLAAGDRIYLVLRDLAAQEQPGVTYQVYVDLPAGSVPDKDDPHYVGFISFYGARPDGSPLFRSFDVTDVLLKLKKQNLLSDQTTITIIPSPSGIRNASAKPVIGKIELVAQSNPPV